MAKTLPSLLFHRGTQWSGAIRGSTNVLAKRFLDAGYPVTWLSRPYHLGHVFRDAFSKSKTEHCVPKTTARRWEDGTLEIIPFTVLPRIQNGSLGQGFWAASAKLGYLSIYPCLRTVFRRNGQPLPDLIWTCGGDGGVLGDMFGEAKTIVQCVDLYEAYAPPAQKQLEEEDYQRADRVVSIGHSLAEYLVQNRGVRESSLSVIGQGADLDLFDENHEEPEDIRDLPRPRLIWLGLVEKADPELMESALQGLGVNQGSLIVVGPTAPWAEQLAGRDPRVKLVGGVLPEKAAAYLTHSDVGLMLYDRGRNPLQYVGQNPLKLYEMAAAGLPIVTTPHEEFRFIEHPALVANTPATVKECLQEALHRKAELSELSRAFARQNGWDRRFGEAEELVSKLIAKRKSRNE